MTHNIYTLTLGNYLKVICDNNLYLLKKTRLYVPKKHLLKALVSILEEYKALSINPDIKAQTAVNNRLERLNKAYIEIYCAVKILSYKESIESYLILRKYYVISSNDSRENAVKKGLSSLKARKIELDTLSKSRKEAKKPSMADYLHEIQILRQNGFQIDLEKMTLAEYVQVQNIAYEQYEIKKKHGTRDN